jgi:hypothetical protein
VRPSLPTWIRIGLAVLTIGVFASVPTFEFVSYDDPWYITTNSHITAGLSWTGVWWAFTSGSLFYWHPLTWLSHMADVQVFGLWPGGHHLTSLILHILNTLVLFAVLRHATATTWRSALVAALFAVHPLHVESVAWVAERKDVLSTLFFLLTIQNYLAYTRDPTRRKFITVALIFAMGLMAKPMLVTLPVVLVLLDVWPLHRVTIRTDLWRCVTEKIPLLVLALVVAVATVWVQTEVGAVGTLQQLPVYFRVVNAIVAYASYVWQMVWPVGLAVFYPYPPTLPPTGTIVAAAVFVAAVTVLAIRGAGRRPYLLVGWAWYLVTLLPVIGLIQAGDQVMADRFTYVPLVGLFIVCAWGAADIVAWRPAVRPLVATAAVAAVIASAVAAHQQVQYWRTSETLWSRALAVTQGNHRAHAALGAVYDERGDTASAIAQYRQALRIVPDQAEWRNNLGLLYVKDNKVAEAMGQFAIATRLRPDFADAFNNLGAMHARAGQMTEAIAAYTEALRLDPGHTLARTNLARAQGKLQ